MPVPKDGTVPKPNKLFGIRHLQCTLLFIITVTIAGMRNILSITVIAMISDDPVNKNIPTYPEWASKKNLMLSSFFWGYVVLQVLAGEFVKKHGPKYLLGIAILINSIFCVVLPYFGEQFGYVGVIACRVIQGLTQGPLLACCHNLLSKWIPRQERARLGNFVYAGAPLGALISFPVAGAISSSSFGWPACFYLYGGIGIAWSITWLILGSNTPATNKLISVEERRFVEASTFVSEEQTFRTPWKSIFTSMPFYAILFCHCGQNWGYYTLITETPSYMEKILDYNLASSSALTALPYLAQWIFSTLLSPLADYLIIKDVLSVGRCRKMCNSIGTVIPGLALMTLIFVSSDQPVLTLVVLVISVGANGGTLSGFIINHLDISPVHAGTLVAIGNSIGNLFSFMAPLAVDGFAQISGYDETRKELWNIVFGVAGAVYVAVGVFYIAFGSGEEQAWSKVTDRKLSEALRNEPIKKMSFIAQSI